MSWMPWREPWAAGATPWTSCCPSTAGLPPPSRGGPPPPDGPLDRRTITVPVGLPPGSRADAGDVATVDLVDIRADGYRLRLVDHPFSFDRPDYYVAQGVDYVDNAARFTLLGRAALEGIRLDGEPVDVLHGHDWEAAPALLARRGTA